MKDSPALTGTHCRRVSRASCPSTLARRPEAHDAVLVFMGILIVRRRVASGKSRQIWVNGNQRISYLLPEVSKLLGPIDRRGHAEAMQMSKLTFRDAGAPSTCRAM